MIEPKGRTVKAACSRGLTHRRSRGETCGDRWPSTPTYWCHPCRVKAAKAEGIEPPALVGLQRRSTHGG